MNHEQLTLFDEISSMAFQHNKDMVIKFLQSSLFSDQIQLFIASMEDVFVGCCKISLANDQTGFYWDGVLPAYRGQGLTSSMTKYRLTYVKDLGLKSVFVQNFSTSLSYCQEISFKSVGTTPFYLLTW